jgi:hypothetical protein
MLLLISISCIETLAWLKRQGIIIEKGGLEELPDYNLDKPPVTII